RLFSVSAITQAIGDLTPLTLYPSGVSTCENPGLVLRFKRGIIRCLLSAIIHRVSYPRTDNILSSRPDEKVLSSLNSSFSLSDYFCKSIDVSQGKQVKNMLLSRL
ncbi:MAG: hypothetical protein ABFR35_10670, partial [Thermodesulfobacteriota bacterium]